VQIDPRLDRLQSLIEQKRALQGAAAGRNAVGKAGNPRFAEAAERVRLARQARSLETGGPERVTINHSAVSAGRSAEIERADSSLRVRAMNDSLLTKGVGEATLSMGRSHEVGANPPHLGNTIDTYA